MSRIDELIAKLCPNGVEYKKIDNVALRLKGSPITATEMKNIVVANGPVRIFAGGRTYVDTDYKFCKNFNINNVPSVIVKSRGIIDVEFYDKPFTFKQEMWAYIGKDQVITKFLFYILTTKLTYLRNIGSKMGSMPQIKLEDTEKLSIPVPPLEIQREIVNVLDTFTKLEAELEAELEARRRQYHYYRDQLLNFEGRDDVQWMTLGEVMTIARGASPRPIQNYLTKSTDGIAWIKIGDVDPTSKYIMSTAEKITISGAKKSRYLKKGDFVLSNSMSFGRPYILGIDGCIHDGWISMRNFESFLNSDFLYHLLRSHRIQNIWKQKASYGTVQNLNADIVRETPIPVPPLEEQARIVAILDKFDALVNDLSSGLPAEIAARRKQYEYYRDRLLTFKEAQ